MPVKVVDGRPCTLGDVGTAYDGYADQTNMVRINGKRAIYPQYPQEIECLDAQGGRRRLVRTIPEINEAAPKGLNVRLDFDQSMFVRATVDAPAPRRR